ncbi:MAG: ComF family protein [Deltaproteobacteria bacterium]|nr:ComF family protein [Deltaproteobacteria bacterium]
MSPAISFILDFIFPRRCLACRLFSKEPLCPPCRKKFPVLPASRCPQCARPYFDTSSNGTIHLCGDCLVSKPPYRQVYALGLYQGLLSDLIGRMKYRKEERLADFLGESLAEALGKETIQADLIVPVPLHPARLRERGFNQASRIAETLGKLLGIGLEKYDLVRHRETPHQTTLPREERLKNLKDAFKIMRPEKFDGKKLLLVDDVYTTGATSTASTAALLKAGAKEVAVAVVARAV